MSQTRFNFIGEVLLPKADAKRPFVKEGEFDGRDKKGNPTGKKIKSLSLNFGVKENDNNMAFVEAFGSEQTTIKTKNSDNEDIEIAWNDRFDEDIVKIVASYRKTTVDFGEELGGRKEFISVYDAIQYVKENLPQYKGKICITGQMTKEWYKDKYYDKFKIQNIYAVDEDKKNRLTIVADIYYNKDSIEKDDWRTEKKISIDGYIQQYINKDEGIKYIPQRFVFNASKYDENNEKHKKLLDYKLKYVDISAKKMQRLSWECVMLNGSEAVEFDESQLTKAQKEQIELGIRKLEDFRPAGSIFGDRVNEYRLFDPKLTGDFADGLVDTEMTVSEFEEHIFTPAKDEKLDDVVKESEKKEESPFNEDKKEEPEVDDDDLF